jgi:hypothetical protein
MDVGRRDFFIATSAGFKDEVDPTWYEGWKANMAYNSMPMFESIEEHKIFGDTLRDPTFDVVGALDDNYLPFYEDLIRAKNQDHLNFLKQRVDRSRVRRDVASRAPFTAQLAAGITDPLFVTTFIPGLNAVGLGKTVLSSTAKLAGVGFGYGVASELRRAPFAVADAEFESASNIAASTALSGFFGGAFKGASYMQPFFKSSAAKVARVARGEKIKHVWADDGVNLDDGYVGQAGGDYDAVVTNRLGSGSQQVLADADMPQDIKKMFFDLTYNSSVPVQGNRGSFAGQSVAQRAVTYEGTFRRVDMQMRDLHAQHIGVNDKAKSIAGVYSPFTAEYDDFFADTFRRKILMESNDPAQVRMAKDGITEAQMRGVTLLRDTFKEIGEDATHHGVFKTNESIGKQIKTLEERINQKAEIIADLEKKSTLSKKQFALKTRLENEQASIYKRITVLEGALDSPPRRDFLAPMYYNKELLLSDDAAREALTVKFEQHYLAERYKNGTASYKDVKDGLVEARSDADKTMNRILEEDADGFEDLMPSMEKDIPNAGAAGGTKHLRHRKINIPEYDVVDYLHLDPDALYAYMQRMGKSISFAEKFQGRNIDEVLDDMRSMLVDAKFDDKKIAKTLSRFSADYQRVMGTYRRNPDRLDNQISKVAKSVTSWTYLPLAGYSAMVDTGSIIMAHGLKDTFKAGAATVLSPSFTGKVVREAQVGGELLDITRNVIAREAISDSVKRLHPNKVEKFTSIGNQAFFSANLLAPITFAGKTLDQVAVNNKFIQLSRKMASGKISKYDAEYLRRYGIDEEMAEYISKMPVSKHDSMDMFFANTDDWPRNTPEERARIRTYQSATSAHANNTVIMGQTFDKPSLVDGIIYMPDNAFFQMMRKKFPTLYKIDKQVSSGSRQMVRIESGAMTLPFTFMNFGFGANNKILGAVRDPNRRHRLQGVMALVGLSYLSLSLKKSDYWFEKRDSPEVLARIIDHSGVLGMYSDLGYTGLSMAVNSGMLSEDGVAGIKPRYISPDKSERMTDALTEPFGAPVGLALSWGRAANDFLHGRYNEGSKELFYNAPFLGLPYIRDDARDLLIGGRN